MLTALAAAEKELQGSAAGAPISGNGFLLLFNQLRDAVRPLRHYSEDAPGALRTLPLSETLANLETTTVHVETAEPYSVLFQYVLSMWREVIRHEILRLQGEAHLEFSTLEEVSAGDNITIANP
jgi:hypothetical protein